jgi:hypothetical protein
MHLLCRPLAYRCDAEMVQSILHMFESLATEAHSGRMHSSNARDLQSECN